MELKERIEALGRLGEEIQDDAEWLVGPIERAYRVNGWFTPENSWKAMRAIKDQFLDRSILENWASQYGQFDLKPMKKVGLVLAGNIPMVGFHDVLCTFVSGHQSLIKTSSKDSVLLNTVIDKLIELSPSSKPYFQFVDQLNGFEAESPQEVIILLDISNNTSGNIQISYGRIGVPSVSSTGRNQKKNYWHLERISLITLDWAVEMYRKSMCQKIMASINC